jgi:DNA polymerase III gamma/tau subunit
MLYQSIRPATFDEIVGNDALVQSLKSMVAADDRPHVFLITGESGCGKTTLARVLATELGCASSMDLVEINAAQARGIDMVRELESMVMLVPWGGKAKMVILDECHQLTTQAQNCLLKVLEDIPAHQYFALCSTDPEKIIPTIRTRCSIYTVKKLRPPKMMDLLRSTCERVAKQVDEEVLKLICAAADGCPRQALVMFEQVMDMDALAAIDAIQVVRPSDKDGKDFCRALLKGDVGMALNVLAEMESEPEQIRRMVMGYMSSVVTKPRSLDVYAAARAVLKEFCGADTFRNGKAAIILAVTNLEGLGV